MEPRPFTISLDPAIALLRVTLRGYWNAENQSDYETALATAAAALARRPGPTGWLIDTSEYPVQAKEVVDRQSHLLVALDRVRPDHIACVIQSALGRKQARRVSALWEQRFFADAEEALAWLLSNRTAAAA